MYSIPGLIAQQSYRPSMSGLMPGLTQGMNVGMQAQHAHAALLANRLAEQKLKFAPQLAQAQIHKMLAPPAGATSPYTVIADPITGAMHMYNKSTGRYVTLPGQESTLGAGLIPHQPATPQSPGLSQAQTPTGIPSTPTFMGATPGAPTGLAPGMPSLPGSQTRPGQVPITPEGIPSRYAPRFGTAPTPGGGTKLILSPTRTAQSRVLQREMTQAGLQNIGPDFINSTSEYQGNLGRGTLKFNADIARYQNMKKGTPERKSLGHKLAVFVAWKRNLEDVATLAGRGAAGGAPSLQAVNRFRHTFGSNLADVDMSYFPAELQKQTGNLVFHQQLRLLKAETKGYEAAISPNVSGPAPLPQAQSQAQAPGGMVQVRGPSGSLHSIPQAQLQEALAAGGQQIG